MACPLHQTRTTVVFGSGNADAELMFIGEAPGANEDKQGIPFVGQAGKLLDKLLVEIGLDRGDVFIANIVKCRPPEQPRPAPARDRVLPAYLHRQLDLIEPTVICTLGKLLDQAPARGQHRHLEPARPGRGAHDRPAGGPAAAAVSPSRGALYALDAGNAAGRFRPDPGLAGARTAAATVESIEEMPDIDDEPAGPPPAADDPDAGREPRAEAPPSEARTTRLFLCHQEVAQALKRRGGSADITRR